MAIKKTTIAKKDKIKLQPDLHPVELVVDTDKMIEVIPKRFESNEQELNAIVAQTKGITATDLEDPAQLLIVSENRKSLKKVRVMIEKTGLELRNDANKYSKAVISHEKKLIEIIAPEEDRLEAIESEAKQLALKKERLEKLPIRKQRIADAGLEEYSNRMSDEGFCEMDANAFETYFNGLINLKNTHEANLAQQKINEENERIQQELKDKQKELDDAAAKLEADRRQFELDKQALDNKNKAPEEISEPEPTLYEPEAEVEHVEEPPAPSNTPAYEVTAAEKARKIEFLKFHGWTKETAGDFKIDPTPEGYVLFKKVGTFKNN